MQGSKLGLSHTSKIHPFLEQTHLIGKGVDRSSNK